MSDHSVEIELLRKRSTFLSLSRPERLTCLTAARLLEMHDEQEISLDHWAEASDLVLSLTGTSVRSNGG